MDDSLLLHWLVENSGPIVRWRVETELIGMPSPSRQKPLERDLLAIPLVQEWLQRLTLGDFNTPLNALDAPALETLGNLVHGGKAACLENVLGKLAEFGLRAGMPELDQYALALMRIFHWRPDWKSEPSYHYARETLVKTILAWGLLRLGYRPDNAMEDFLLEHLQSCHKIAHERIYDLYAYEIELAGLPKAWVGKPILRQEIMANYWLPTIHDLTLFAHLPASLRTETVNQQIADLLTYILDPRFQALPEGYGYAWIKERRTCTSWGWSPHLPGFHGFHALPDQAVTPFLSRLELLARFPSGRQSGWVHSALRHLHKFRTRQGTYLFPAGYLREAEGYYVSGYGMGLGENRRKPAGLEIESTFRLLKISRLAEEEQ